MALKPGRKPGWIRAECARLVDEYKLIELMGKIAAGKIKDHKMTKDGVVVEIEASLTDRQRAMEYLIDQSEGKAPQNMALTGGDGEPLTIQLINYADFVGKKI